MARNYPSVPEVTIIGLGAWGLCLLERIIHASYASGCPLVVHVVEPRRPGGGMFSEGQPDYLVLNTPCGQHSVYPSFEPGRVGRLGLNFYDWARQQGYRWEGWECRRGGNGVPIGPHDFLPRRLMGEYLCWAFEMLCAEAPEQVRVVHHRTSALDIEAVPGGKEKVYLADGTQLLVDNVVLTTGHMAPAAADGVMGALSTRPYPLETYLRDARPQQKVAIEGMGLAALDVLTALTMGLGGSYSQEAGGKLRYHPSGREPMLYMFSRSGYPYCAKSFGAADPMGEYQPAICTMEAIGRLKQAGSDGRPRSIDARHELLPLVFAEMELCYYSTAARVKGGNEAARGAHARLASAWAAGRWEEERARAASEFGPFDAARHFFVGAGRDYEDAQDYQGQVYTEVEADAREAFVTGGASPVKAALETVRALRDTIRFAVEFKGLTLASHLDFFANLQSRFARLVAGPPVARSQQLLALMEAGILQMPLGPGPEVLPQADGRFWLRSTALGTPHEVMADRLVRAHLDPPSVGRAAAPLLANLSRRGRLKPLQFNGTPVGSVDINEEFHPVNRVGQVEDKLWVFGVLTEGARYFTLYIPSPKSRVRAFVDAEACARAVTAEVPRPASLTGAVDLTGAQSTPVFVSPLALSTGPVQRDGAGDRGLRIALVNNMPDSAFEETEEQFCGLLSGGFAANTISFERYTLPGILRGPQAADIVSRRYGRLADLYANPPDALIITGAAPKRAELTEELFWPALERLFRWAAGSVPSALVSCLSAHAALWAFDGLPRRLLLRKCHGVFPQVLDEGHPLAAGVTGFAVPHSRFNEIPMGDVADAGYRVVCHSLDAAWTVAVGERGMCQLTLLQGHPEYHWLTLLREYRRDVRCYLLGNQGSYPYLPMGYLGPEGEEALLRFQRDVSLRPRDAVFMAQFPYDAAARDVQVEWAQPGRALLGNWLQAARQRVGLRSFSQAGA